MAQSGKRSIFRTLRGWDQGRQIRVSCARNGGRSGASPDHSWSCVADEHWKSRIGSL